MWNSGKWRRETERYRNLEPEDFIIMINYDFVDHTAGWWAPKKSHPLKPYNHPWIKTARTWNTKAAKKEHPAPCQIVFFVFQLFFVILPSPEKKKDKTSPLPKTKISVTIPNSGAMLVSGEGNTYICVVYIPFPSSGRQGTLAHHLLLQGFDIRPPESTRRRHGPRSQRRGFYWLKTGLEWMCVSRRVRWGWT